MGETINLVIMGNNKSEDLFKAIFSTTLFTILYFGSLSIKEYFWFQVTMGSLGAVVAYFIGGQLRNFESKKYFVATIICVLTIVGLALVSFSLSEKKAGVAEMSEGTWESDDSDKIILRFRFQGDSVHVGIAPNYVEKSYLVEINDKKLRLFDNDGMKFSWSLEILDDSSFVIASPNERVLMLRKR